MALEALSYADVEIVGWSDPRYYDAGEFTGEDGVKRSFPAGVSMFVFVGTGVHDCDMVKVRTAPMESVLNALGASKTVENGADVWKYKAKRGQQFTMGFVKAQNGKFECRSLDSVRATAGV